MLRLVCVSFLRHFCVIFDLCVMFASCLPFASFFASCLRYFGFVRYLCVICASFVLFASLLVQLCAICSLFLLYFCVIVHVCFLRRFSVIFASFFDTCVSCLICCCDFGAIYRHFLFFAQFVCNFRVFSA